MLQPDRLQLQPAVGLGPGTLPQRAVQRQGPQPACGCQVMAWSCGGVHRAAAEGPHTADPHSCCGCTSGSRPQDDLSTWHFICFDIACFGFALNNLSHRVCHSVLAAVKCVGPTSVNRLVAPCQRSRTLIPILIENLALSTLGVLYLCASMPVALARKLHERSWMVQTSAGLAAVCIVYSACPHS